MCWNQVEEALEGVKNAINEQDLANRFKEFGKEMVKLNYVAARRQQVFLELCGLIPISKNTAICKFRPLILHSFLDCTFVFLRN